MCSGKTCRLKKKKVKEICKEGGQHKLQLWDKSAGDKLSKCLPLQGSSPCISPMLIRRQLFFFFFLNSEESTSFRLFEILEIALSSVDEMKIYSWCQQHINAFVVCHVL